MLFTFLFLLLVIGYFILSLVDEKRSFFYLPLFLVTHQWKVTLGSFPFNGFEIMIYVFFVAHVCLSLFSAQRREQTKNHVRHLLHMASPLLIPSALLCIVLVSLLWIPKTLVFETGLSGVPPEVFSGLKIVLGTIKGWFFPLFILVYLFSVFIEKRRHALSFLFSMSLGVFFVVALGFLWTYGLHLPGMWDGRFEGLYVSPNYLVFLILPTLLFLLFFSMELYQKQQKESFFHHFWRVHFEIQHNDQKKVSFILGIMVMVLFCGLVLARSYASWMVFCLIIGVYSLFKLSKKAKMIAVALFLIFLSSLFVFESHTNKFKTFTETVDRSSTSVRVQVYTISLELLKEHPVMGIGPGLYEAYYKLNATRILGKPPYEWVMLHPHNLYLAWWLALGVFGFLLLMYAVLRALIYVIRTGDWVMSAPLVALLLHGIVDTPFWKLDVMFLFFAIVFLPLQLEQNHKVLGKDIQG